MNNLRNELLDLIEDETENITDKFYKDLLELVAKIPDKNKDYILKLIKINPFVCSNSEDPELEDNRYIGINLNPLLFEVSITQETRDAISNNIGRVFNPVYDYLNNIPQSDLQQLQNIFTALKCDKNSETIKETEYEISNTIIILSIE